MAKFTKLQKDFNAERDFYKAVMKRKGAGEITAPRSVAYYHHTATSRGYVDANDRFVIHYYKGKFGEGFVFYRRNYAHPSMSYKGYFIFREYFKEYKK